MLFLIPCRGVPTGRCRSSGRRTDRQDREERQAETTADVQERGRGTTATGMNPKLSRAIMAIPPSGVPRSGLSAGRSARRSRARTPGWEQRRAPAGARAPPAGGRGTCAGGRGRCAGWSWQDLPDSGGGRLERRPRQQGGSDVQDVGVAGEGGGGQESPDEPDHPVVVGLDRGGQRADAVGGGELQQVDEELTAQAHALPRVLDEDGELRRRGVVGGAVVAGDAHDLAAGVGGHRGAPGGSGSPAASRSTVPGGSERRGEWKRRYTVSGDSRGHIRRKRTTSSG